MFMTMGDLNSDGVTDLITANSYYPNRISYVSVLLGNGDGTFASPLRFEAVDAFSVATGDFNNDGLADLVAVGNDGVSVLLNQRSRGGTS